MINAALEYARRGWPVLPLHSVNGEARCTCGRQDCPSPGKHPRTAHGVKDATTDEKEIRAWWSEWPGANIGVPTGAGTFVSLDLDRKDDGTDGAEVVKALHGWEPEGPLQRTGGGGLQALYAHPGEHVGSKTDLLDGVDVKGDGGYVVVPPSLHISGNRYEWIEAPVCELPPLPDWLTEALSKDPGPEPPSPADRPFSSDPEVERRAVAYLAEMPPAISGQRGHDTCYAAATAIVHGFGIPPERAFELLVEHYNPRCKPPWSEKELRHKVDDAALRPHDRPFGWLREPDAGSVDLSRITAAVANEKPDTVFDPGPIPDELLHVPGFVNHVMEHTLSTSPYPNRPLAFAGALVLQGHLAGRRVRDSMNTRTNLYVLALGSAGIGKERMRKVNQEFHLKTGVGKELADAFASGEGIEDALDLHPRLLLQTDEFDKWLNGLRENSRSRFQKIMETLLKMFSSADGVWPVRLKANQKERRFINQPSLSILGTAIPKHFYQALSPELLDNGFFARMLVVEAGERGTGSQPEFRPVPEDLLQVARAWQELRTGGNLSEVNPELQTVPETPEAHELLLTIQAECDARRALAQENDDEGAMALWARACEKTRRLALVYACSEDHQGTEITVPGVEWAWAFVQHQTQRMLFMIAQHVADGEFDALCLKALRRVRREPDGEIAHSVLLKHLRIEADRFRKLIETLQERGDLLAGQRETGGRPGVWYRLPGKK
ncbi:MAG: bifunctional DNA primase/polymerase [Candidatus Brocadiia bacterium]